MQKRGNRIFFHEYADFEAVWGECSHSFPTHIHESLCIGSVTGGRAEFIMNGRKKILSAGDRYVIPPYAPHSLSSIGPEKFNYFVLCFKNKGARARPKFNGAVADAKTYIEASRPFNIAALSKAVHISKYHLVRIFKEQVGITPYQFYIGSRIKKIRQGVRANVPLPDLAFDLNFSDQSHLCNTFKKHMGLSPTQYACSYRNGQSSAGAN